jgi:hypothetical protein
MQRAIIDYLVLKFYLGTRALRHTRTSHLGQENTSEMAAVDTWGSGGDTWNEGGGVSASHDDHVNYGNDNCNGCGQEKLVMLGPEF